MEEGYGRGGLSLRWSAGEICDDTLDGPWFGVCYEVCEGLAVFLHYKQDCMELCDVPASCPPVPLPSAAIL